MPTNKHIKIKRFHITSYQENANLNYTEILFHSNMVNLKKSINKDIAIVEGDMKQQNFPQNGGMQNVTTSLDKSLVIFEVFFVN